MLSLEEQIARIADAAFDQTSPVEWSSPHPPWALSAGRGGRRRRSLMVAAVVVLGLVLVGGLVVSVDVGRSTPVRPVNSLVDSRTTLPVPTLVPTTVTSAVESSPSISEAVTPSVAPIPPTSGQPQSATTRRPLVAINGDGDAVLFPTDPAQPQVLFDGQDPDVASQLGDGPNLVDRVSVAGDQSLAYIGLCCAPGVGTILATRPPEVATEATPIYGFAPTLNPSATLLASALPETVAVTNLASGDSVDLETFSGDPWGTTADLAWLDDSTLAVLNVADASWTLTIVTTDGITVEAGPTRVFAVFEEFPQLRFAGAAIAGEIAVHDAGTDRVLTGTIDEFGNLNGGRGSSLQVIRLPAAALSAWYTDPAELIWIDSSQMLHVGNAVIPGTYTWARR
jgi:hypothetical protein